MPLEMSYLPRSFRRCRWSIGTQLEINYVFFIYLFQNGKKELCWGSGVHLTIIFLFFDCGVESSGLASKQKEMLADEWLELLFFYFFECVTLALFFRCVHTTSRYGILLFHHFYCRYSYFLIEWFLSQLVELLSFQRFRRRRQRSGHHDLEPMKSINFELFQSNDKELKINNSSEGGGGGDGGGGGRGGKCSGSTLKWT